jgi:outer membrane protein
MGCLMKSTWNVLILLALSLTLTTTAQAEFIGLNIGTSNRTPSLSNSFNNTSDLFNQADDDQEQPSLLFILEHSISALPNVKYQGFNLDSTGSDMLNGGSLSFNNQAPGLGPVSSSFDLSNSDFILYYELMDNWVNLDFGLDLKSFNGEVSLYGDGSNTTIYPVDEIIPLFYLSARFDLPFDGFYIGADINSNFSVSDSIAEDSTFMLGYQSDNGVRVEGGIKRFSLDLNSTNDLDANLEYNGLYLNGFIPFD